MLYVKILQGPFKGGYGKLVRVRHNTRITETAAFRYEIKPIGYFISESGLMYKNDEWMPSTAFRYWLSFILFKLFGRQLND